MSFLVLIAHSHKTMQLSYKVNQNFNKNGAYTLTTGFIERSSVAVDRRTQRGSLLRFLRHSAQATFRRYCCMAAD